MSVQREKMDYDVVIVGGGPAGLAAACRLKQLSSDISVCLIEKGSEIGTHIISGAVIDPLSLAELFPDWQSQGAPLSVPVKRDLFYLFRSDVSATRWPQALLPNSMSNKGNYVISLGNLCRWLAAQAESLGVEIYPGFAAQAVIMEDNVVKGIITGDHGVDRHGQEKAGVFLPGMELRARFTLLAEGSRGHIGKQIIEDYHLDQDVDPQHYAIGIKELWEIDPEKHEAGLVIHGAGWPLDRQNSGGSFLYHYDKNRVGVGLIVDLNYANPYLSPFEEFQRIKKHPVYREYLQGGKRIGYGARAITKGGYHSLPKMIFPGGALIGCDLGTLNFARIKGIHTAMKSGMLAAEAISEQLTGESDNHNLLTHYPQKFKSSWLYDELYGSRNFGPAIYKYGTILGGAINVIDQNLFAGRLPVSLHSRQADHLKLLKTAKAKSIKYDKPDNKYSFDRLSSVYLANINHPEDQPVHLKLTDSDIPLQQNLPLYAEPAQRYCPAAVYEVVQENHIQRFQINAQNCIHCKVCDIKDPLQNITWVAPEGGSGPNYSNM